MADTITAKGEVVPIPPALKSARNVIDRIPLCDTTNPGDLESWYGPFGFVDHFRKVVLSSCKEIERAKNPTASESKLDTLAHVNDRYVDFLIECLNGRRKREQNVLDSTRTGAFR